MEQPGKRSIASPCRVSLSKRAKLDKKDHMEGLPDAVLSVCLSYLPCDEDLAALLCASHICYDLQGQEGAWSSLYDSHALDTKMLRGLWLSKVPMALGPVQAASALNRWQAGIFTDKLSPLLSASLSARACAKHELLAHLTELPSFHKGITETSRLTRCKGLPGDEDSDCEDPPAYEDSDCDSEAGRDSDCDSDDYGLMVPLHGKVPEYGKLTHELSYSVVVCGLRLRLEALCCCEVDESDCMVYTMGSVHVTPAVRRTKKSPNSEKCLLSWRCCGCEDEQFAFNRDCANQLASTLASDSSPALAPSHMPGVLTKLLAIPFNGVRGPHDFAFESGKSYWGEYLKDQFFACAADAGEGTASDLEDAMSDDAEQSGWYDSEDDDDDED